jgi:hypothetical protein
LMFPHQITYRPRYSTGSSTFSTKTLSVLGCYGGSKSIVHGVQISEPPDSVSSSR